MGRPSIDAAPEDPATVGKVVKPHGLAGEIVVEPADPRSTVFRTGAQLWLAGRWRTVRKARDADARRVIAVDGVGDRDAAEELRGEEIAIEAGALPELGNGAYYIHDLVGCHVRDAGGEDLGVVVGVVPGPHDWLEVEKEGVKSLVPMVRDMVKAVDTTQRRIVIDPPRGLAEATQG